MLLSGVRIVAVTDAVAGSTTVNVPLRDVRYDRATGNRDHGRAGAGADVRTGVTHQRTGSDVEPRERAAGRVEEPEAIRRDDSAGAGWHGDALADRRERGRRQRLQRVRRVVEHEERLRSHRDGDRVRGGRSRD